MKQKGKTKSAAVHETVKEAKTELVNRDYEREMNMNDDTNTNLLWLQRFCCLNLETGDESKITVLDFTERERQEEEYSSRSIALRFKGITKRYLFIAILPSQVNQFQSKPRFHFGSNDWLSSSTSFFFNY